LIDALEREVAEASDRVLAGFLGLVGACLLPSLGEAPLQRGFLLDDDLNPGAKGRHLKPLVQKRVEEPLLLSLDFEELLC
jgi:hypothetical protein